GLGGVMTSHVAYPGNPYLLNLIRAQLGLPPGPNTFVIHRVFGRLFALSELLVLPLFVGVVCALGVVTVLVAAIPGAAVFTGIYWVGNRIVRSFVPGHIGWSFWKVFLVIEPVAALAMMAHTLTQDPRCSRLVAESATRPR